MADSRTYKFEGRIFQGFNKDFSTPHRLVLVQDEDVLDVWAIDGKDISEEMDELLRYFTMSQSQAKLIGTYAEKGFLGLAVTDPDKFVSKKSRWL